MGLCCSKRDDHCHHTLIHPGQPVYFNIPHHNRPPQFYRPPPYNPASYQFNAER